MFAWLVALFWFWILLPVSFYQKIFILKIFKKKHEVNWWLWPQNWEEIWKNLHNKINCLGCCLVNEKLVIMYNEGKTHVTAYISQNSFDLKSIFYHVYWILRLRVYLVYRVPSLTETIHRSFPQRYKATSLTQN